MRQTYGGAGEESGKKKYEGWLTATGLDHYAHHNRLLAFALHTMHQEFYSISELLAHLRLPTYKITEGLCRVGRLSNRLAGEVQTATGLDVRGFELVLDRSGVQHALKQHGTGSAVTEIAQGQVPIEEADFLDLSGWLLTPQTIRPGQLRPGRNPMPCVEFYATLPTGRVCVILKFRPGRKRLVLTAMYKKRPTA